MTEPLREEPTPRVDAMLSVALKYEDITQFARTLERALVESERKLAAAERQNFDHASAIEALETELRHEEVIRKALQKVCNGLEAKLEQARQALETLHGSRAMNAWAHNEVRKALDALATTKGAQMTPTELADRIDEHVAAQHMGGDDRYAMGYNAGIAKMAYLWKRAAVPAGSVVVPEWIAVSEKLPERENQDCLIACNGLIYGALPWKFDQGDPATKRGGWMDFMEGTLYDAETITHWMLLPPPPISARPKERT